MIDTIKRAVQAEDGFGQWVGEGKARKWVPSDVEVLEVPGGFVARSGASNIRITERDAKARGLDLEDEATRCGNRLAQAVGLCPVDAGPVPLHKQKPKAAAK